MRRRNAWGDSPVKPSDTDVQPIMGGRRKTRKRKGGQPPGLGLSIKKPKAQNFNQYVEDKYQELRAENPDWSENQIYREIFPEYYASQNKKRHEIGQREPSTSLKPSKNFRNVEWIHIYNENNNNENEENVEELNLNADPNTWNFNPVLQTPKKNIRLPVNRRRPRTNTVKQPNSKRSRPGKV